jgi:hypothetical protein
LICPFDTSLRPGSSGNESGFRPVSVRLDPHATAEGRLLSGINLGLARARVLTSPEIPNEKVPFDESYSKDPYVDVFYPREEMTQPILFDSAGKIRQGLKAEIVLQTSGGHLRESALTATLEISPVEKDFEFAVSSMKTEYKIHSRTCWAVIQSTRLDQEYSKSELQPPH